jgi:sortase A
MSRSRIVGGCLRGVERTLTAAGLALLAWCALVLIDVPRSQAEASRTLDALASFRRAETDPAPWTADRPPSPGAPVGRLEIPRLDVSAIVREGSDARTLRRAVGRIPDTAMPGTGGNVGLAGHRDTFFRPLRHIRVGDEIVLTTPRGRFRYTVRRTRVVDPDETWVLDPATGPALTLVTCYPFYFVGPAPRRFVVRAEPVAARSSGETRSVSSRPASTLKMKVAMKKKARADAAAQRKVARVKPGFWKRVVSIFRPGR